MKRQLNARDQAELDRLADVAASAVDAMAANAWTNSPPEVYSELQRQAKLAEQVYDDAVLRLCY